MSRDFRSRLLRTLRAVEPILRVPGVLVVGSEVPNLLEPDARSSLVVSQDVDIAVPVARHADVKARLPQLHGLSPSREEPSVWLPAGDDMIEVNFIGMDPDSDRSGETYVLEDRELPLLVFRYLGLLRPGPPVTVEGIAVPVPRPAGLLLEKLVTDRSGEKGDRTPCRDIRPEHAIADRAPGRHAGSHPSPTAHRGTHDATRGQGTVTMTDRLHRRARLIRERELIRAWEYRQRDHAKGVWYRFRRVLVDAAEAWVIDDRDADRLAIFGRTELPVGGELHPPKRIFFVTAEELAGAPSRRRVPLRLAGALLGARNLALIAFAGSRHAPPAQPESGSQSA